MITQIVLSHIKEIKSRQTISKALNYTLNIERRKYRDIQTNILYNSSKNGPNLNIVLKHLKEFITMSKVRVILTKTHVHSEVSVYRA